MASQVAVKTATKIIKKSESTSPTEIKADVCVVGAGIAGITAALVAARQGHKVVLVDGMSSLGGNSANAAMGLFCGFFTQSADPVQLVYGIGSEIIHDLQAGGHLSMQLPVPVFDEVALGRWYENRVREAGVTVMLNALISAVHSNGRRVESVDFTTRFGNVRVIATGFVDASGDAALTWNAGLPCRESESPLYSSQLMFLEHVAVHNGDDLTGLIEATTERLKQKATEYGLMRRDGFLRFPTFLGDGVCYVNMTHVATPVLEPVAISNATMAGKDEADRVLNFLRSEFPKEFSSATIRKYGILGIRQTRWIVGAQQLTVEDVRTGRRFADSVARTAWPIELHDRPDTYVWEVFGDDHVHYVPYGSLTPPDADNIVAAGRCIDGEVGALSSVRVMGPCVATGTAAANALDLAGNGSVHDVDMAELQSRLSDNLNRMDRP